MRALVRLAAVIASNGAPASYQSAVDAALAAGAPVDDLIGVLIAVAATIGNARVVAAAPRSLERSGSTSTRRSMARTDRSARSPREHTANRTMTSPRPHRPVASPHGGCGAVAHPLGPSCRCRRARSPTSPRSMRDGLARRRRLVMGSEDRLAFAADGETHREVEVSAFMIDSSRCPTPCLSQFSPKPDTSHKPNNSAGRSFSRRVLPDQFPATRGVVRAPGGVRVYEADLCHPEGPHSDVADRADHPAVTFSAMPWLLRLAGKRLPVGGIGVRCPGRKERAGSPGRRPRARR